MDSDKTPLALYVHWPFCVSKCPYCDFNSHVRDTVDQEAWRDALLADLAHEARALPGRWGAAPAARRATWSGRAVRAPNPNDSPAGRFASLRHHRTRRPTPCRAHPAVPVPPRPLPCPLRPRPALAAASLPGSFRERSRVLPRRRHRPRRASILRARATTGRQEESLATLDGSVDGQSAADLDVAGRVAPGESSLLAGTAVRPCSICCCSR